MVNKILRKWVEFRKKVNLKNEYANKLVVYEISDLVLQKKTNYLWSKVGREQAEVSLTGDGWVSLLLFKIKNADFKLSCNVVKHYSIQNFRYNTSSLPHLWHLHTFWVIRGLPQTFYVLLSFFLVLHLSSARSWHGRASLKYHYSLFRSTYFFVVEYQRPHF